MTREDAEEFLTAAGKASDEAFPLFEATLACAVHEDPSRDPRPTRALAEQAAERLSARMAACPIDDALAEAMAGDLRFTGDLMTYDHPDNADIITVWERRKGLPVALGVLYIDAARRCGLPVAGVDFPGHFLLRVESDEGAFAIDPADHHPWLDVAAAREGQGALAGALAALSRAQALDAGAAMAARVARERVRLQLN